jgi:hypothetical protein
VNFRPGRRQEAALMTKKRRRPNWKTVERAITLAAKLAALIDLLRRAFG